jgi:hypothetical protein
MDLSSVWHWGLGWYKQFGGANHRTANPEKRRDDIMSNSASDRIVRYYSYPDFSTGITLELDQPYGLEPSDIEFAKHLGIIGQDATAAEWADQAANWAVRAVEIPIRSDESDGLMDYDLEVYQKNWLN